MYRGAVRTTSIIVVIGGILLACVANAATIYVPDNYATIQGAIDASANGDTVIVRPGTYVENIKWVGKAITVQSELGPSVTTIDGNQSGSVVRLENIGLDSVLDGFTLTNGMDHHGGGISGILFSPTIINNIITGNTVAHNGGGIRGLSYEAYIANNVIFGNSALERGGGISWGNSDGSLVVKNNLIFGNTAALGGGLHVAHGDTEKISNNTILDNNATEKGGGVYIDNDTVLSLTNTIVWNNTASSGSEIALGVNNAVTTLNISYCDVKGGQAGVFVGTGCTLNWGPGMIDADPLFADSANCDYHLTWNSPCRDTGDNSIVTEIYDFEGDPRITLGTVDIGADEFYYHLYHVGDVAPGSSVDVKLIGYPLAPVTLAWGQKIIQSPHPTQHGDLHIWPFIWSGFIGTIQGDGMLTLPVTITPNWIPGDQAPLQALVGPWGGALTRLSNLHVLRVE